MLHNQPRGTSLLLSTSFLYWGAQKWTQNSPCGLSSCNRGERWYPSTWWLYFLYQKGTLPAHVQIVHQDLFWKLFSSCATAIMCCCMGLFFPRCRTLRFPLWNFMRGVQVFGAEVALAASKEHDLMFLPHYLVVFIGVAPWLGRVKLSFSWCWREIFVRARIRADLHEVCHGF